MRTRRFTLAIGMLATLIGSSAYAQEQDVKAQLLEQGEYWQARGNHQRATEVWQKMLLIDSQQVEALYGLGRIAVAQKKLPQANTYLARLQALSPVPWQASQLMQDIALASPDKQSLLEEARRLVDEDDREKANDTFLKMFDGLTPQGTIGREYYNNLAYTKSGWPEARRGMERLLRETPNDSILALFYAKQLARHEDSRADGVRLLAKLTKRVDIAGDADESWQLALIWMGPPKAAQIPLFEEFLKAHPDDQQVRALLNKGRQQLSGGTQNAVDRRGLNELEKGDMEGAEKAFQARLASNPDDRDALGGLGIIRQKQNRLTDAEQLLSRAAGKGASQWTVALNSVRYWLLIQQGRDLQNKGQTAQAQQAFAQAVRLDSRNIEGRVVIADAQASAGELDTAEASYRQVLAMQPGYPAAVSGLINVLSQAGKADEALNLLDGLAPADQEKLGNQAYLKALRATQQADLAEQQGDLLGAQHAMREAISYEPNSVWTTYHLAHLYVKSGDTEKAYAVMDSFVNAHRDNADGLYASALLSTEMQQWVDARNAINRIPADQRTTAMNTLADQIMLNLQINQASSLYKNGQHQQALALLDGLQPMTMGNPDYIAMLAQAYADAGDSQRALGMMQPLVMPGRSPSPDLMLQYASVLMRTGDDAQVYSILRGLQSQTLSAATRSRYDDLRFAYRVRQADRLREAGDLALAYDTLVPALTQRPNDTEAMSALARMYIAAGNNVQALALYKPMVKRHPQDAALLLNAADTAVLAQDNDYANDVLKQFVKLDNKDPATLTEAARIYRTMNKVSEATALLRKAVALENSDKQYRQASSPNGINLAVNPFRTQRRQQMTDAASAIPLPAEALVNRTNMARASDSLPAPATARSLPVAAPVYSTASRAPVYPAPAGNLPVNSGRGNSAAQNQLLALQGTPQTVDAPADNLSPAQRALNEIQQSRSAYVTQGVSIRSNTSEPGLSQLDDVEAPLEVNIPAGDSRLALRVTPVSLDAGNMNDDAAPRFGSGGASAVGVGKQNASGVGISLAYATQDDGIKADIGTTPLGFKYQNLVGGVSINQPFADSSNARFGVLLSRRAVTDSLTSFAGTTDRRENLSWGGVTANGGRAEVSYDDAESGVYGYGALHRLLGNNVRSNTRVELGAGAYQYLENTPDDKLTVGLSATMLHYDNNQNMYTYGHGGYFSPQAYLAVGVPVTWAKRYDKFTFQVKGSLGAQYFRQDAEDYFPTDSSRQAASGLRYASQSKTGVGYSLEGAGEYQISPKLMAGGVLRLNNSNDFREINASMYLRYTFEDMRGKFMTIPVSPYRSPYAN